MVDPEKLGKSILALIRLRYPHGNYKPFHDLLEAAPEILEAHHVTGDDCFVLKVAARSMSHLEEVMRPDLRPRPGHHQHRLLLSAPPQAAESVRRGQRAAGGGQRFSPPDSPPGGAPPSRRAA